MNFVIHWLGLLSDHFNGMAINILLMEARLKRLEKEVEALRQQGPKS